MAKSVEAQELLAALNAELGAPAKGAGEELVWPTAEEDILGMIGAAVDRRVELSAAYEACESTGAKLKVVTASSAGPNRTSGARQYGASLSPFW